MCTEEMKCDLTMTLYLKSGHRWPRCPLVQAWRLRYHQEGVVDGSGWTAWLLHPHSLLQHSYWTWYPQGMSCQGSRGWKKDSEGLRLGYLKFIHAIKEAYTSCTPTVGHCHCRVIDTLGQGDVHISYQYCFNSNSQNRTHLKDWNISKEFGKLLCIHGCRGDDELQIGSSSNNLINTETKWFILKPVPSF